MANRTKQNLISLAVGFLFAIGLGLSGMTQPHKVIAFLDPWNWDPSLLFVMVGAIGIHGLAFMMLKKRASPLLDTRWHFPTRKDLTARLVIGSALFGLGWGLGGFCPGPSLTSLSSGNFLSVVFVGAMILGMLIFKKTESLLKLRD